MKSEMVPKNEQGAPSHRLKTVGLPLFEIIWAGFDFRGGPKACLFLRTEGGHRELLGLKVNNFIKDTDSWHLIIIRLVLLLMSLSTV